MPIHRVESGSEAGRMSGEGREGLPGYQCLTLAEVIDTIARFAEVRRSRRRLQSRGGSWIVGWAQGGGVGIWIDESATQTLTCTA